MKISREQIARRIRQAREGTGHSQAELAMAMGISRPSVSQIETGTREVTTVELVMISQFLGIPVHNLLFDDTRGEPEEAVSSFNAERFKEVLLHILEKVGGKPNVGETVLYKLLYFSDFDYFEKYGQRLTGATYIKNHYGPSPAVQRTIENMINSQEIGTYQASFHGYGQKRYIANRSPKKSVIGQRGINIIDAVIRRLGDKTAKEVSAYSHKDAPWQLTPAGQVIDYDLVKKRSRTYSVMTQRAKD